MAASRRLRVLVVENGLVVQSAHDEGGSEYLDMKSSERLVSTKNDLGIYPHHERIGPLVALLSNDLFVNSGRHQVPDTDLTHPASRRIQIILELRFP